MLRTKAGLRSGLAAILMASMLAACAPEMKMTATGSPGVAVRFARGEAMMVSAGERGAIALIPRRYNGNSRRVLFVVAAYDRNGIPYNFGTENITIGLDTGVALTVHDFDQLRHKAKVEANESFALSTLLAAIELYGAHRVGRHDRPLGRELTGEAWDHYAERNMSIGARLMREAEEADHVLQTTTVDPQSIWGGWIIADQPPLARGEVRRMTVNVEFAGEVHHFAIYLAPEGTPTPREADLPAVTRADGEGLLNAPQTWLWDVPPPAPKPVETTWTVTRF